MRHPLLAALLIVFTGTACEGAPSESPSPVVDKLNRTVEYPLDCDGEEPSLEIEGKKAILTCPGPDGRRLKVVCPIAPIVSKQPNGGFHFECT